MNCIVTRYSLSLYVPVNAFQFCVAFYHFPLLYYLHFTLSPFVLLFFLLLLIKFFYSPLLNYLLYHFPRLYFSYRIITFYPFFILLHPRYLFAYHFPFLVYLHPSIPPTLFHLLLNLFPSHNLQYYSVQYCLSFCLFLISLLSVYSIFMFNFIPFP